MVLGLFDGGMRFSPSDIEPFPDDAQRVRSAGRMLQDAAGALDFAQRASAQLQNLTDGVSWRGNAFQAFKGSIEKQPLPQHLINARDVLGWAGDGLTRLAMNLDDVAADYLQLRNRADLLGIDGDVPEPLQPEVEAIKREYDALKERRGRAVDHAAHLIDEMTDRTVFAKPPKGFFGKLGGALKSSLDFAKDFGVGIVQGTVDIGKGLVMLGYLATPMGMMKTVRWFQENRHLVGAAITYAINDPVGMATNVGKVMIDYDTLKDNPGRWLGKLVPQIAIAVATAGVGGMATRSGAIAGRGANATGRFVRYSDRIGDYTKHLDELIDFGPAGRYKALSRGEAFNKGVVDTFVNKPLRNIATGGAYGRAQRARYLLHTSKEIPLWGKVAKKVPVVTAAASAAAARESLRDNLAATVEDGATRVEEKKAMEQR